MKTSEELDSAIDEMRGKTTRTPVYMLLLELKALRNRAAVLVKSLEFYGDINNRKDKVMPWVAEQSLYWRDAGKRARQALATYQKGTE